MSPRGGINPNGLGYEWLRGLALNFVSTHQAENSRGFSEVGENQQLLIAIVVERFYSVNIFISFASINSSIDAPISGSIGLQSP